MQVPPHHTSYSMYVQGTETETEAERERERQRHAPRPYRTSETNRMYVYILYIYIFVYCTYVICYMDVQKDETKDPEQFESLLI